MTQTQDPAIRRAGTAYRQLYLTLTACLPPPPDDTPESLYDRNEAAIARTAALCPVTAAEAVFAAQAIAAAAHAEECMRLANAADMPLAMGLKCTAQATSMMRQSQSAVRTLQNMQAIRIKRDKEMAAAEAAAVAEHIAGSSMAAQPKQTIATPDQPPQPEPAPAPEADAYAAATETPERTDEELYAILHPRRAAAIRRHGGMPPGASFAPPDDALVQALLTSRSPVVRAVDSELD